MNLSSLDNLYRCSVHYAHGRLGTALTLALAWLADVRPCAQPCSIVICLSISGIVPSIIPEGQTAALPFPSEPKARPRRRESKPG